MRNRVLMSLFIILLVGCSVSAQEWPKAPPPLGENPSFRVSPPSKWVVGWPVPTLKDPGLRFQPSPGFAWVWTEGQARPNSMMRHQTTPPTRKKASEATVEVWDLSLPERPKERAFLANLEALNKQVAVAMQPPPPRHGDLDLAYLMLSDPSRPQDLELARMKSLHVRFNRLPPNRSLP